MSGHSKWSKVKHQKESTDATKGKIFTKLSNAITIAVKEGGGGHDPDSNFKLRLAIEKAKSFNMPKDKIERAIARGKGIGKGEEELHKMTYEAFGPEGVGIIIEVATDNKKRAVAEIKSVLDRAGGVLATSGAVSCLFKQVGLIHVGRGGRSFDQLMEVAIDAGAIDLEDSGDTVEIFTEPTFLQKVKEALLESGVNVLSFELYYRPQTVIKVKKEDNAQKILKLLSKLEEIEDVQKVSANFDIPENLLVQL